MQRIQDKRKKMYVFMVVFFMCSFIQCKLIYASVESNSNTKNVTKAYFCADVTRGKGNGDLILLENYDKNGKRTFGLIDTGRMVERNINELSLNENEEENEEFIDDVSNNSETSEEFDDGDSDNEEEENSLESSEDNPDLVSNNVEEEENEEDDYDDYDDYDDSPITYYNDIIKGNKYNVALKYLKDHGVTKETGLDFLIITHQHVDHHSNAVSILEYLEGNVGTVYMKETDNVWVNDTLIESNTERYYDIIKTIIKYNIKVVGTSFRSLKSSVISPTMFSDEFKEKKTGDGAKMENFEVFTKYNTIFKFGSATIQLFNWEIFDTNGKEITIDDKNNKLIKDNISYAITKNNYNREITTSGENGHSLGALLTQGNKKAFLAGDLNNSDTGIKIR